MELGVPCKLRECGRNFHERQGLFLASPPLRSLTEQTTDTVGAVAAFSCNRHQLKIGEKRVFLLGDLLEKGYNIQQFPVYPHVAGWWNQIERNFNL